MRNIPLITGTDEAIPEVLSDVLADEVFRFLCNATFLNNDDELYTRFWTELSGDGRRLVRGTYGRLARLIDRDSQEV